MASAQNQIQEHILSVNVTTDEANLGYVVKLESPLPLFKVRRFHPMGVEILSGGKITTFHVKPKRCELKIRHELRKAQKKYRAIIALRNHLMPYNPKVNLTHKIGWAKS